jgi:hypothetical protein
MRYLNYIYSMFSNKTTFSYVILDKIPESKTRNI